MAFLIIAGTVLLPPGMWITCAMKKGLQHVYDALAVLAVYTFGIMSALAVYEINRHNTVLTTEIHKLFMKPLFLAAGAYLGLYGMYRLIAGAIRRVRGESKA
jgi:hypothetical protein